MRDEDAGTSRPPEVPQEAAPVSGRVVGRFLGRARRAALAAAAREGRLRRARTVELLAPERLRALAATSLQLFLAAGVGFTVLDLVARGRGPVAPLLGRGPLALGLAALLAANLLAYAAMIVAHEAVHAAVILALGGRPRFGVKWPLAAYCTAPDQFFTRAGYLTVALAPLVALTGAGVLVTVVAPNLGAYLWLGFVGNVAGAVGDLLAVRELRRVPQGALIADTETGFVAYEVAPRGRGDASAGPDASAPR